MMARSSSASQVMFRYFPSGHDAWVVGNEPAVVVDFQGMLDYAKAK